MTPIEIVAKAQDVARKRQEENPDGLLYDSVIEQLKYLMAVLKGVEKNRSRLRKIIIGRYATKEFAETDPELAAALIPAQHIASTIARGLKV